MKHLSVITLLAFLSISTGDSWHSYITTLGLERTVSANWVNLHQLESGIREVAVYMQPVSDKKPPSTYPGRLVEDTSNVPMVNWTASRFPIGARVQRYDPAFNNHDMAMRGVSFSTEHESGTVTASGIPEARIAEVDAWLEKIARLTLAKYAADQRIRAGSSQSVNGRSLAGFTAQKSNVNFVRFADWANARGIQYTYDSAKCTISFTRNGKSVLLPVAAKAVRVNGTWRDLPDIVMISPDRDERTLVPVALDALTN